ncbi:hypothetical protein BJY04DRAFT_162033 [Aspergillus karnatakaensis]|uniref:uncharacterized protein n=1 Tax=Aspergillus karnatakaensis TaxID=1810916 RepID=UPI003CCDA808
MGSSLSLQSRDKRRRSNRLSKPPQNQATLGSPSLRPSHQPVDQALSLPPTPTAWQDPWTGSAATVDGDNIVSSNVRSQSFSFGPLRHQTWSHHGSLATRRNTQITADACPQSPTSSAPSPERRSSFYKRASFQPSATATYQPTTLQSNPQTPLIGPPKRSYSVHCPPKKPSNSAQRLTLERFSSFNPHSKMNDQGPVPIRRRSLLMRPGVATRTATRDITPTLHSGPCLNGITSPNPPYPHDCYRPPLLTHENILLNGIEPFPQLRPPTPSDFGYSHLGTLQLGSLRVVNGSASPCSSDRTRLGHAGSPLPDATVNISNPMNPSYSVDFGECAPRPVSPSGLSVYANYQSIISDSTDSTKFDHIMENRHIESVPPARETCRQRQTPARSDIPATMLSIPAVSTVGDAFDFPASPFSFENSPTFTSGHRMKGLREVDDEGISVCAEENTIIAADNKVPERHVSYSSCASSHRKVDSGYSSATSHRTSIDSHASLRRSPGFRKFALERSFTATELCNWNVPGNQSALVRRLSFQNQRHIVCSRPTSMSETHPLRPQAQANGRLRGSSLPVSGSSGRPSIPPFYCAQLRSTNLANYAVAKDCHNEWDIQMEASTDGHGPGLPIGEPALRRQHQYPAQAHRSQAGFSFPLHAPSCDTSSHDERSSCVATGDWLSLSAIDPQASLSFPEPGNRTVMEPPRGRTRSRSIECQRP